MLGPRCHKDLVDVRPEVVLCQLQLAELEPDAPSSRTHLREAVAELQAMAMRPCLERGLAPLEARSA